MDVKKRMTVMAALLIVSTAPVMAQQSLGQLISENGYDAMIGEWVAFDGSGQKYELKYQWVLDRHAVRVAAKIGEMQYEGMIVCAPYSMQITQIGADNRGGIFKGTWSEDYSGAAHRMEYVKSDGMTEKLEHVHTMVGKDTLRIREYAISSNGWRESSPRGELIFNRGKKK